MKLHNVPLMSRRGEPKHEIHQPKAGKNSNDQNSNDVKKLKTDTRYRLKGQKLGRHDAKMCWENPGIGLTSKGIDLSFF
jgi:hypothetical protein